MNKGELIESDRNQKRVSLRKRCQSYAECNGMIVEVAAGDKVSLVSLVPLC